MHLVGKTTAISDLVMFDFSCLFDPVENGGAILGHGSGGVVRSRAA